MIRVLFKLLFCLNLVFLFGCKEKHKEIKSEFNSEIQIDKSQSSSSRTFKKEKSSKFVVIAKSGLNYRETPNGKVLGKLNYLEEVVIIKHTNVYDVIKDGFEKIEGHWLAIKKDDKKVYVFSAFVMQEAYLNQRQIVKIPIYPVYNYDGNKGETFIPLSEVPGLTLSNHKDSLIVPSDKIGTNKKEKDVSYFELESIHRNRFLKRADIAKGEKVFVYNCFSNKEYSFTIEELKLVARLDPYLSFNDEIEEYNYQIGFELPSYMNEQISDYSSFVYIGNKSPFLKGKMKQIKWRKLEGDNKTEILKTFFSTNNDSLNLYTYKNNSLCFYLLESFRLVVFDTVKNKKVFDRQYGKGEGTSSSHIGEQWTGKLFKDYPEVTFGYQYASFGCPIIDFIENQGRYIHLLCDNRH